MSSVMGERGKRKTLSAKTRLRILQRDNLRCTNCGSSPALNPGIYLEIDRYDPFSKGGTDDDTNLKWSHYPRRPTITFLKSLGRSRLSMPGPRHNHGSSMDAVTTIHRQKEGSGA